MLAEQFQKMYQNLNINIDSDLEQLKVRATTAKVHICCLTRLWLMTIMNLPVC